MTRDDLVVIDASAVVDLLVYGERVSRVAEALDVALVTCHRALAAVVSHAILVT